MKAKILGRSILCLVALMVVSTTVAEEPTLRALDTVTAPAQVQPLFLQAPPLMSVATPARASLSWQQFGFGACYDACANSEFNQRTCGSQRAQLLVSGPYGAAYLGSYYCTSTCSGPLVNLVGFTGCV